MITFEITPHTARIGNVVVVSIDGQVAATITADDARDMLRFVSTHITETPGAMMSDDGTHLLMIEVVFDRMTFPAQGSG